MPHSSVVMGVAARNDRRYKTWSRLAEVVWIRAK